MFSLTKTQTQAVELFKQFMNSPRQVFMLKGAAGTGKTTLVTEFLKILCTQKRDVSLMAPTGRAAFIISHKTKHSAFTIHKTIYTRKSIRSTSQNKETEDDGGLHIGFGIRANEDSERTVYIIDEASLISDIFSENEAFTFGSGMLLSDLFTFARGRKIVFVGDYAQLPPIGMNFSPALSKDYIEDKFDCKVTEVMLREVMRQSEGSVMLKNANKLRDCIEQKTFIEFKLDNGADTATEDTDLLHPYFQQSPDKPMPKGVVIAYSNRQALEYNLAIRHHCYGENAPRLQTGDLLMISRNNYAYDHELFNGNIVQVEACSHDDEMETRQVRVKLRKDCIETVLLRFRKATIRFKTDSGAESMNVKLLDNFLDDPSTALGGLLARALIVDFNNRLPLDIKGNLPKIKKLLRAKTGLDNEQQELQAKYLKLLMEDPYYNAVICKYGYAVTCHKAQGGEWENVFVDMGRFGGTANENYFRWAYTAITRASKKIWLYRSPDFDYISDIVVEPIQLSSKIKVKTYSDGSDFREARFAHILKLSIQSGLCVTENKSRNFQHWVTFNSGTGDMATFALWYGKDGYSDKITTQSSSSDEFSSRCMSIVNATFAPEEVPFHSQERPFANRLVDFMKSQLKELDIGLLYIEEDQYMDVFHLKTDGIAKVSLAYTGKGNYTYMRLVSSLGKEDTKLEELRKRFI